jgi:hypothetical protein
LAKLDIKVYKSTFLKIRAAAAYWVEGRTLHYVTLQHEEKQAPIESVDRDLSMRLNRERRVTFSLPQ